ncbi:MAG: aspartate/tyrosine/aromatic aminotransferase [Cellvibrionaceae bacterium]
MFEKLSLMPCDPILGVMAEYRADPAPHKIDLSVGVYKDESGHTPVMAAVKKAEALLLEQENTKSYLSPLGSPEYNASMLELILGREHPALLANRARCIQTTGGCGALRVAAEFILRANPEATIWVSDPTWGNHVPLLGGAGVNLKTYPYYNEETHSLDFNAMYEALEDVPAGDLVLLHGCCHNPTGADLTEEQWAQVAGLAQANGFTPFVDVAYQGLGDGLEEDAVGLRIMADAVPEMLIAASCSKNFGLYRERTGALIVMGETPEQADASLSHLATVTRGLYSMPPSHGGAIVETILTNAELNKLWRDELAEVRSRVNHMRSALVSSLRDAGVDRDFSFITQQKGMFSFLGITPEQVLKIRKEHSVYLLGSSRINVAGITPGNVGALAQAIKAVL